MLFRSAKYRSTRKVWTQLVRERFGGTTERAQHFRLHAATSGRPLTAQQPLNNIARITLQALAQILGGCESGFIAVRPDTTAISYAGCYGGALDRQDARIEQERAINPWPDNPMGYGGNQMRHRFQWTYPIVLSDIYLDERTGLDVLNAARSASVRAGTASRSPARWRRLRPRRARPARSRRRAIAVQRVPSLFVARGSVARRAWQGFGVSRIGARHVPAALPCRPRPPSSPLAIAAAARRASPAPRTTPTFPARISRAAPAAFYFPA